MTTATAAMTNRRFGMHSNLLMHVIQRQAGTLAKAILEGVMNSVDAGSTRCEMTLDSEALTICDDGRGFADMTEIEECFEQFGTPHQEGDATYGQFRLGRGQLFCFGANTWRSRTFRMDVDIQENGLDYALATDAGHVEGCEISVRLYDRLVPSDLHRIMQEVREFVLYTPIPVTMNGEQINKNPLDEEWDFETEDAWYRLKSTGNTLAVYNLGVLAEKVNSWGLGSAGIVVSKRQLKLNMARNQIDSKCAIWRRIKEKVKAESRDSAQDTKKRLTDAERAMLATDLVDGEGDAMELLKAKLLTDVRGRHLSADAFYSRPRPYAVAKRGDRAGEKLQEQKLATVLAEETLTRFGVASLEELLLKLAEASDRAGRAWMANTFRALAKGEYEGEGTLSAEEMHERVVEGYEALADSKLSKIEQMALHAIRQGAIKLYQGIRESGIVDPGPSRHIRAGSSAVAHAWTDGASKIFVEKGLLKRLQKGISGACWIMRLLVHEYIHSRATNGSHAHDFEFLDAFHELMLHNDEHDWIGIAAERTMRSFLNRLDSAGARKNKAVLEALDHEAILANVAHQAKEAAETEAAVEAAKAADAEGKNTKPKSKTKRKSRKSSK